MTLEWIGFIAAFALLFYLSRKEVWVALAVAGVVVGLFSLPLATLPGRFAAVVTSPAKMLLALVYGLIPLIGGVLNSAGRFREMADNLPIGRRSFLWITPAFVGLLPVPGGAMLSAPMVKEVGSDLEGDHGFSINIWFRHILVLVYPLSSLLICAPMANVSVYVAGAMLLPGAALMGVVGYLLLIRKVPRVNPNGGEVGRTTEVRKWLYPALIILAAPAIHLTTARLFPQLANQIPQIPLLLGVFSTFVLASLYSHADLKGIVAVGKKTKPWKFALMVVFMFFFLETFEATSIPAFLAGFEYSPVLLIVPASFLVAFLTGRIPVAVSVILPIYVAKFGSMPAHVFAVFYFAVFLGYMVSPLHPCVLVTLESFGTTLKAFFRRLATPVLALLLLNLGLSFFVTIASSAASPRAADVGGAIARETIAGIEAVEPLAPPSARYGPLSVEEAYRVQDRFAAARGAIVGYKIAFASRKALEAWGLEEPVYGPLFADQRVEDGGAVTTAVYGQLRFETELAFVLSRAVDGPLADEAELRERIASVHLAFDLPDGGRFSEEPSAADVIATGAGAHRFVLGPPHDPAAADLDGLTLRAVTPKGAETVYEGRSGAVRGGQWGILLWAVNHLAGRGKTLPAGTIFLTGAVDRACAPAAGAAAGTWIGEGGPLGEIRVVVTSD